VSYVHKTQIYVSKYKVFQRPIYTTARKKTCGEKQFVCRTPYDTKLHTKKLGKANNWMIYMTRQGAATSWKNHVKICLIV